MIAVGNGREAVEAVRNQHFDVIITDLVMPELDGWEVLEFVRTVQPQPRVIIITAHAREETGKIAINKGAWAFVEKPYIIDKIKGILKEELSSID